MVDKDNELREQITKLMHPVSYEVIYPETQSELGYPIATSIIELIKQRESKLVLEARIDELSHFYPTDMWLYTDASDPNYPEKSKPVSVRINQLQKERDV